MTEFTSDRLEFRTWCGDDEERLGTIMTDDRMPEFWRNGWAGEKIRKWLHFQQEVYKQSKLCNWALWHRSDNILIGFCGLVPMIETGEIEIGWALAQPYWKHGLATEACCRVVAYAKWLGHDKLVALTQPGNEPSMRLAERIGMKVTLH